MSSINPLLLEYYYIFVAHLFCMTLWLYKHKKVNKNWYFYNKDYARGKNKEYENKNLDKKRARWRKWYKANKEKVNKERVERYYRNKYLIDKVLPSQLDTTRSKEAIECERSVKDWFYKRQ